MSEFGSGYRNTDNFQACVAEQERVSKIEAARNILGDLCPMCGGIDGMAEVPPWDVKKYNDETMWRRGNTLNVPCMDCNSSGVVPAGYERESPKCSDSVASTEEITDDEGVYDEHFWFQD